MQYIYDDGIYKVVRITGPKHNFLGIKLANAETKIKITTLPIKDYETSKIDADDVLNQVNEGLIVINEHLGKKYYLSEVQFIPSDTMPSDVYKFLIQELIVKIDQNKNLNLF